MFRLTVALLFMGCFMFTAGAQTAPSPENATQPPAAETAPAGSAAAKPQTSDFLDQFKQFSALMSGGPVPAMSDEVHIYRSGDLMRMEGQNGKTYQISDLAKQETHGMATTGCLRYKIVHIRAYPFLFSRAANKFERTPVGKETVDGHVCQVEDVIVTLPKNPSKPKFRLWEAEDLQGFPIKVETRGGPMHQEIRYRNVVLGPQDPTLFIFPDECQISEETIGVTRKSATPAKKTPSAKPQ
jgi:hypothetical protein